MRHYSTYDIQGIPVLESRILITMKDPYNNVNTKDPRTEFHMMEHCLEVPMKYNPSD